MTGSSLLPEGFESLEPFVAEWAISGMAARAGRRDTSTPAERRAFYDAACGLVMQALARLEEKPVSEFDPREQRLMALMLSYAHVAIAVEVRGDDEAVHVHNRRKMVITHAPAEQLGLAETVS